MCSVSGWQVAAFCVILWHVPADVKWQVVAESRLALAISFVLIKQVALSVGSQEWGHKLVSSVKKGCVALCVFGCDGVVWTTSSSQWCPWAFLWWLTAVTGSIKLSLPSGQTVLSPFWNPHRFSRRLEDATTLSVSSASLFMERFKYINKWKQWM